MKNVLSILLFLTLLNSACSQEQEETGVELTTKMQKVSYAIGNNIGKNFLQGDIELLMDELFRGIKDGVKGTSLLSDEEINTVLNSFQQEMMAKQQAKMEKDGGVNKDEGEKFLAENKNKEGVMVTASGLQYKILKKGSGSKPTREDKVTVHYRGSYINGEEFDSSFKRNQPATFPVTGVIPGWTEALLLMNVGDKFELYIPYNLAYGENGKPPVIEPYKTLLFEVELLEIAN